MSYSRLLTRFTTKTITQSIEWRSVILAVEQLVQVRKWLINHYWANGNEDAESAL